MAKKAKVNGAKKSVQVKLPAGFTAINVGGGFGAWWDHSVQSVLTGTIVGTDSYMAGEGKNKKERRILRVEQDNGVVLNVGESYSLKELFEEKKLKGRTVYIEFLGQDKFKKDGETRKINKFAVGLK